MKKTPYVFLPVLSPLYRRLRRIVRLIRRRGTGVHCVVCKQDFRSWIGEMPDGDCPGCGSSTRHKLAAMHLEQMLSKAIAPLRMLMFAPDPGLESNLRRNPRLKLVTTDFSAPGVDHHWDITCLPVADASFDLILCSHVLEHVPDDKSAMSELHRVLSPGGTALLQVPYAREAATTDEDLSDLSAAVRTERFGQFDHLRVYGRDLVDQLSSVGFHVDVLTPAESLSVIERARLGLWNDVLFVRQARHRDS